MSCESLAYSEVMRSMKLCLLDAHIWDKNVCSLSRQSYPLGTCDHERLPHEIWKDLDGFYWMFLLMLIRFVIMLVIGCCVKEIGRGA